MHNCFSLVAMICRPVSIILPSALNRRPPSLQSPKNRRRQNETECLKKFGIDVVGEEYVLIYTTAITMADDF